ANECIVSITEPDYKNLNKNDIEDMYLLIMNNKVPDYANTGLLWSLSVFIRSSVIWERVHDFQLGIESYQQKINLTAPTITFLGIKEYDVFSIVYEPVHGIIYTNSKKEKRVMRHSEIHKFCDATLRRTLEGLKSFYNDVEYGYVQKELTNDEVEFLKLFEEEIEVRLNYRGEMELANSQNNALAKLPMLTLGENANFLGGTYSVYAPRIWSSKQIEDVKKSTADNNDDKNLAFLTTSSPSSTNTINTVNTGVNDRVPREVKTTEIGIQEVTQRQSKDYENFKLNMVLWHSQILRSAEVSTADNGEVKITATYLAGNYMTITEASLRRHLKLDDQDGVTSLPNSEIFEQLALMGYHTDSDKLTFQKGAFSPQWRFLIHCILHCISPKKTAWEQFSSNIATAVICLATNRKFNFSRMIFEHMVSNITSPHKFLMYPRFIQICLDMQRHQLQQHTRTYHVPSLSMKVFNNMKRPTKGYSGQEVALFPTMLDDTAPSTSPSRITSSPSHSPEHSPSPTPSPSPEPTPDHTTAAVTQPSPTQPSPTLPSPGAEHTFPTPHDSPLHVVHSHRSDEGSLTLKELMNLVTK
ncbi:hypothetical protein Tco_1324695, partial [Tanacetum coccineum]